MPSQETQWFKDVRLIQMLDDMRKQNMAFMATCHFCDQKSEGIKAVDYRLYPVCPKHMPKDDLPPRPEEEIADIWANEGGSVKDEFWSTQTSFEE